MASQGRPTKYTEEINQAAKDYISNYKEHNHAFPSIVGMAFVLNIAKSTLYLWANEERGSFSDTLEHCCDSQEFLVLNGAIRNNFNSTISKLVLANFGYHDKADNTLSGGDKPILIGEVQRTIVDPEHSDS